MEWALDGTGRLRNVAPGAPKPGVCGFAHPRDHFSISPFSVEAVSASNRRRRRRVVCHFSVARRVVSIGSSSMFSTA